jgi:hypothetical protein
MTDKSIILKSFNNHFFEFLQDIITIFPENEELQFTKTKMEMLKKANPTCIIKAWYFFVFEKYNNIILNGDITFFFDKDYKQDLEYMQNSGEIMNVINKLREPIRNMSDTNKEHTLKYMQNLCKLSDIYMKQ